MAISETTYTFLITYYYFLAFIIFKKRQNPPTLKIKFLSGGGFA